MELFARRGSSKSFDAARFLFVCFFNENGKVCTLKNPFWAWKAKNNGRYINLPRKSLLKFIRRRLLLNFALSRQNVTLFNWPM